MWLKSLLTLYNIANLIWKLLGNKASQKNQCSKPGFLHKVMSSKLGKRAKAKLFHESGRMEKADPHQATSGQRDDYVCWIVACHG